MLQRKEPAGETIYAIRKLIYEKGNITGMRKLLMAIFIFPRRSFKTLYPGLIIGHLKPGMSYPELTLDHQ